MLEKELFKSLVVKNSPNGLKFSLENIGLLRSRNVGDFNCMNFLNKLPSQEIIVPESSLLNTGFAIGNFNFPIYSGIREDGFVEIGPNPNVYLQYAKQNGLSVCGLPIFFKFTTDGSLLDLINFTDVGRSFGKFSEREISKIYYLKEN